MMSNIILRSTAAFGGAPFRLSKCTALGSADAGAAVAVAECACGGDYGCLCAACVYGYERHRRFRDAYAQPRCHR